MGSPGLGREAEPGVTAAVATTAPGCPRVAAGLAWLHCEGDQRLERHQSLHANGERQRVGRLAATTFENDRYKPGWSASLRSGGWMFHLIKMMPAPG